MSILAFQSRAPAAQQRRSVSWVVDWFLKNDQRMRSPVAKAERKRLLGLFCAYRNSDGREMGPSEVEECVGADLVEFLNANRAEGSQWTRRRWASTIKRPFREAAKLGLIPFSPFAAVTERKGRRGRDITWDEFRALLRLACPAMRRILLALRWCGARPGELRKFEWGQMDWLAGQIVQLEHKTSHLTEEPRVIKTIRRLLALIKWIKANHPHGGKYVFVNSYGGAWTTGALCKNLRGLRGRAGLPKDVRLYGCRHAWITEAILNGVDISIVAHLAGHKSITTTQGYCHFPGKDGLGDAAERAFKFNGKKRAEKPLPDQEQIRAMIAMLQGLLAGR